MAIVVEGPRDFGPFEFRALADISHTIPMESRSRIGSIEAHDEIFTEESIAKLGAFIKTLSANLANITFADTCDFSQVSADDIHRLMEDVIAITNSRDDELACLDFLQELEESKRHEEQDDAPMIARVTKGLQNEPQDVEEQEDASVDSENPRREYIDVSEVIFGSKPSPDLIDREIPGSSSDNGSSDNEDAAMTGFYQKLEDARHLTDAITFPKREEHEESDAMSVDSLNDRNTANSPLPEQDKQHAKGVVTLTSGKKAALGGANLEEISTLAITKIPNYPLNLSKMPNLKKLIFKGVDCSSLQFSNLGVSDFPNLEEVLFHSGAQFSEATIEQCLRLPSHPRVQTQAKGEKSIQWQLQPREHELQSEDFPDISGGPKSSMAEAADALASPASTSASPSILAPGVSSLAASYPEKINQCFAAIDESFNRARNVHDELLEALPRGNHRSSRSEVAQERADILRRLHAETEAFRQNTASLESEVSQGAILSTPQEEALEFAKARLTLLDRTYQYNYATVKASQTKTQAAVDKDTAATNKTRLEALERAIKAIEGLPFSEGRIAVGTHKGTLNTPGMHLRISSEVNPEFNALRLTLKDLSIDFEDRVISKNERFLVIRNPWVLKRNFEELLEQRYKANLEGKHAPKRRKEDAAVVQQKIKRLAHNISELSIEATGYDTRPELGAPGGETRLPYGKNAQKVGAVTNVLEFAARLYQQSPESGERYELEQSKVLIEQANYDEVFQECLDSFPTSHREEALGYLSPLKELYDDMIAEALEKIDAELAKRDIAENTTSIEPQKDTRLMPEYSDEDISLGRKRLMNTGRELIGISREFLGEGADGNTENQHEIDILIGYTLSLYDLLEELKERQEPLIAEEQAIILGRIRAVNLNVLAQECIESFPKSARPKVSERLEDFSRAHNSVRFAVIDQVNTMMAQPSKAYAGTPKADGAGGRVAPNQAAASAHHASRAPARGKDRTAPKGARTPGHPSQEFKRELDGLQGSKRGTREHRRATAPTPVNVIEKEATHERPIDQIEREVFEAIKEFGTNTQDYQSSVAQNFDRTPFVAVTNHATGQLLLDIESDKVSVHKGFTKDKALDVTQKATLVLKSMGIPPEIPEEIHVSKPDTPLGEAILQLHQELKEDRDESFEVRF